MGTEKLDVKKELIALDHKLLDLLVKRFEFNSYIADGKYAIQEGEPKILIEDEKRRSELVTFFRENGLKKAKEKELPNPEEFAKFVSRVAEETLLFSWEVQKEYLKQKYNLKCD
jgi:chorismate mutase